MWFGVLLLLVTLSFTALVAGGRIDSPEEFVMALRSARAHSLPIALSLMLVITTLPQPTLLKRVGLAFVTGAVCWFLVWQWLVQCDFGQIRHRGGDPEQMLRQAGPV
jgi:hypothetical protein